VRSAGLLVIAEDDHSDSIVLIVVIRIDEEIRGGMVDLLHFEDDFQ
jgi:hypothetical protein